MVNSTVYSIIENKRDVIKMQVKSLKAYHGRFPWPSYYDVTLFFLLSHQRENLLLCLSHSGSLQNGLNKHFFWGIASKNRYGTFWVRRKNAISCLFTKNVLIIKIVCFSSDFDETLWDCSTHECYNLTKFHQNRIKNKNFLFLGHFL